MDPNIALGLLGVSGLLLAGKMRETAAAAAEPPVGVGELPKGGAKAAAIMAGTPTAGASAPAPGDNPVEVTDQPYGNQVIEEISNDGHGDVIAETPGETPPPAQGSGVLPSDPIATPGPDPTPPPIEGTVTPLEGHPGGKVPPPPPAPPASGGSLVASYSPSRGGTSRDATSYFASGAAVASGQLW